MSNKYISVFMPTLNGEKYLAESLDAILNQELPADYKLEVIIIDSGSTDHTMSILDSYEEQIHLVEIPNEEFSHGGTRQRAAVISRGEFVLFITQDATPANNRWIINMIEPFFLSEKVGCVFGRQVPRANAAATIKREVTQAFDSVGSHEALTLHRSHSLVDSRKLVEINTFFSDANSAVRRDLLVGPVPFRQIDYAEDQALAEDMQKQGYVKAYSALGVVWHSNEYTVPEYARRKFDEFIALKVHIGRTFSVSRKQLFFGWIRPTIADWKFILKDRDYPISSKIKWGFLSPGYNTANNLGLYRGSNAQQTDGSMNKYSLESSNKSK